MQVQNGVHADVVGTHREVHSVRKSREQGPAVTARHLRKLSRRFRNPFEQFLHPRHEPGAKTGRLSFVPEKRRGEVLPGRRGEADGCRHVASPPRRRMRPRTSSQVLVSSCSSVCSRRRNSSRCHSGTGTRSGCAEMRSHSDWMYSICSSTGRSSKPGGGVRTLSLITAFYREQTGQVAPGNREHGWPT